MESRCLLLFQESIRSPHTRKQYLFYLKKFCTHSKTTPDELVAIPKDVLQMQIEDYVISLKRRVESGKLSKNTIPTMIFGVKAFCDANELEIKWPRILKLFPEKEGRTGTGQWTTEQIQDMLNADHIDKRGRALIHFLAASGVRIGAIPELKRKHLEKIENCYSITVYPKSLDEYYTFLTPEASRALDDYFEHRRSNETLHDDSPLFRTDYANAHTALSKAALQEIVSRILVNTGLRTKNPGVYQRYETQIDTGFRKRFDTIFADLDLNLTHKERMMGHSVTVKLDNHYYVKNKAKLFETYKKAIPELTVDDSERQRILLEKQEEKINYYESEAKSEIDSLREEMARLGKGYSDLINLLVQNSKDPHAVPRFLESLVTKQYENCKKEDPELAERLFGQCKTFQKRD